MAAAKKKEAARSNVVSITRPAMERAFNRCREAGTDFTNSAGNFLDTVFEQFALPFIGIDLSKQVAGTRTDQPPTNLYEASWKSDAVRDFLGSKGMSDVAVNAKQPYSPFIKHVLRNGGAEELAASSSSLSRYATLVWAAHVASEKGGSTVKPTELLRKHGSINKAIRHYVPTAKKPTKAKRTAASATVSQPLAQVQSALLAFAAKKPEPAEVKNLPYLTVKLAEHPEFAKVRKNGTVVVGLRRYQTTNHFHLIPNTLRAVR